MHATEAGYSYDRLSGIRVELDDGGGTLDTAYAYCSRFGCLNLGFGRFAAEPVGLQAIGATGRNGLALSQAEAQERVREILAPDLPLNEFIAGNVADAALRAQRAGRLAAEALPLTFARETIALF
jgi:hypothetical protein